MPKPVFYVDGDDPVLISEAVVSLVDALLGEADRSLALEDIRGEEVDLSAVADGCATPPLLSDRRVVVIRDIGAFQTEEVMPLLGYLEHPLESTTLVLAAGGGAIATKLLAAVKAVGEIRSTKVGPRDSRDWVRNRIRGSSVSLDAEAEQLVIDHLGGDVSRLGVLLEVLTTAYGDSARLGAGEVEPYLGAAGSVAPWELTGAIEAGRPDEALDRLHRLLGAGEHPLVILALLRRQVDGLLRVDSPSIRTEAQAATAMGIAKGRSTYPAKRAMDTARRWGSAGVAEAVGLVADADLALKGASALPGEAILEVLVARLCRLARAGPANVVPIRRRS